ncbi:MAG TPA: glycosyltransferase family 87 protein [Phycisphaerae bacterium]|nr:glycosyltransferase family 87 protein [Phycisphaerae bacterium]
MGIAMIIYFTAYVWRRVGNPQHRIDGTVVANTTEDWAYYYAGAKAMRDGKDIYQAEASGRGRAGYIYPPLLAFLYQPLTRLDFLTGARISLLIDELAAAAALAIAARGVLRAARVLPTWQNVTIIAVAAALLSSDKLKGEFQMLQCNGLVALGIAVGLTFLDDITWLAGLALGFAVNIKYQALGLVLYLIFRRRWKALNCTFLGIIGWALLPALSIGIHQDFIYLVKGFSGVLRLVGFTTGDDVANVEPISVGYSVSITSAAAGVVEQNKLHISPFVIAGAVALLWLMVLAFSYHRRGIPLLRWPPSRRQASSPWALYTALEWMAVVGAVLAFSPQTNSRHLLQTALINVLAVVLVAQCRQRARWWAVAAVILLWMGLNLPPGDRGLAVTRPVQTTLSPPTPPSRQITTWRGIGGPSWAILVAMALLVYAGQSLAGPSQPAENSPSPGS